MNETEQRIKLAEFDGFYDFEQFPDGLFASKKGQDKNADYFVPQYFHDLNACHELEMKFDDEGYRLFIGWLVTVLKPGEFSVRATAPQRCEALLRTIGQWTETPQPERTV